MTDAASHDHVAAYDAQPPRLGADYERIDQVAIDRLLGEVDRANEHPPLERPRACGRLSRDPGVP